MRRGVSSDDKIQGMIFPMTLRSSSYDLLIVPHRVKTVTASRAFRVAAPTIWNNVPDFVKVEDSFNVFKRRLKCYLFNVAFKQPSFQPASLSRSHTSSEIRRLKSVKLYCIVL